MGTKEARDSEGQAASNQARLQKMVLNWDYYRLLSQSKIKKKKRKRDGKDEDDTAFDGDLNLRDVPDKFKNLDEYLSIFEALLLEECRSQILRGEEEGGAECHMVALATWEKANEFYFLRLGVQSHVAEDLTENDILLLSKEKPLGGAALPNTYAFASVENREGSGTLRIRMNLDGEINDKDNVIVKPTAGALRLRSALQGPTSAWWIMKLSNMSTILREYTALRAVGSLLFADIILFAEDPSGDKIDPTKASSKVTSELGHWNVPSPLKEYLGGTHNPSQMQAIQLYNHDNS